MLDNKGDNCADDIFESNLTVLSMNVQGLPGKESYLEVNISLLNLDILCLSEHWLTASQSVVIDGFFCASKYVRDTRIRVELQCMLRIVINNKYGRDWILRT